MSLLLDTHALLWWLSGDERLSASASRAISSGGEPVFISSVSVWEIATKYRLGKLPIPLELANDLEKAVVDEGFIGLPLTLRHGQMAGDLPGPHRDPFDRMLIAQAMAENLSLVSNERPFDAYGVRRLW